MRAFPACVAIGIALTASVPAWAKAKGVAACPATTVFNTSLDHLSGYRVFTGPDGDSAVEPLRIDAKKIPMFKTGKTLNMIGLPKVGERSPYIVVGPPDVDLPMHAAPYKEMFVLLGGSVTIKTAKFSAELKPGSVLLFEDVVAKVGHGGRTGPCGYISLSIPPAP